MAFSNLSDFVAKLSYSPEYYFTKNTISTVSGVVRSSWTVAPNAGSAPSTAEVPTNTTTGALVNLTTITNPMYLAHAEIAAAPNVVAGVGAILIDRLSHQGGLSGTVTTAQTTNLPTSALTRYTDGVGVMIGLEIYTAVGISATTATASYTNQAGTSGRTTKAVAFGGTGISTAGNIIIMPLQDGDTGVKSVESVTLAGTTATAGNFGVTLFKPLASFPALFTPMKDNLGYYANSLVGNGGGLIQILSDACLSLLITGTGNPSGVVNGYFKIVETA